ncbi:hypothetical protein JHK85_020559 [Glycine max]|nr:hypothetical protein JHK85_020559 [Glycine max]
MAIATLKFACKPNFLLRPAPFQCIRKLVPKSLPTVEVEECRGSTPEQGKGTSEKLILENNNSKVQAWKKLNSKELGLRNSMIAVPTKKVLNVLKKKGHDVYLVGGCVRDLILKQTPKDFDIITSADLKEVSSFNTARCKSSMHFIYDDIEAPNDCDKEDYLRWRNCLKRDFTINGLMFDPYARIVYDYMGGMEDIIKAKVRTVVPAATSFREDCARILRAIRVAARLGFSISRETAQSVKNLSYSVLRLDKSFFSNVDKLLAPNRPCHSSLWVAILALHKALSDKPRDSSVVAAFSLALHNGGNLSEAINIARRINKAHDARFPELLDPSGLDEENLEAEILDLAESVKGSLLQMTDRHLVSGAMADYPQAPHSNLVLIPLSMFLKALNFFDCVNVSTGKNYLSKQGRQIDYESLARGDLLEVRHVFARIVFDTVYPLHPNKD